MAGLTGLPASPRPTTHVQEPGSTRRTCLQLEARDHSGKRGTAAVVQLINPSTRSAPVWFNNLFGFDVQVLEKERMLRSGSRFASVNAAPPASFCWSLAAQTASPYPLSNCFHCIITPHHHHHHHLSLSKSNPPPQHHQQPRPNCREPILHQLGDSAGRRQNNGSKCCFY